MWYMNEDREMLQQMFREFAQNELRPFVPKMEEEEEYPKELIRKLGELGMLGLCVPEEFGGSGKDYVNYGLMIEEVAKESHTFALLAYLACQLTSGLVYSICTPDQIERFIKPSLSGDILLGIGITEPGGVFNIGEFSTTAVEDGDDLIINGGKILITNADVADVLFVFCKTGETVDPVTGAGISLIAVPTSDPGFSAGHMEHKLGWKGSHTGQVYFDNIRVPKTNVIGEFNNGWFPMIGLLMPEFATYGPMNLGAAEAVLAKTIAFLKERTQMGVSLWDAHESIRCEVAKMHMEIENYRNAVYGALENRNRGEDISVLAIALKVQGEELLEHVAGNCIELHGGMGTVYETGIERYWRDAKMGALGCGSNKTFLSTIGSMM